MSSVVTIRGNQEGQSGFLRDRAPGATAFVAGWGSGKSWAASRKLLWFHALNDCPSLAVAPTYGDLWRFVVPNIVAAAESLDWECQAKPNGSGILQFPHLMVLGQPIILLSGEHPERFAGFEVGAIWADEAARLKESRDDPLRDTPRQMRSRLRHPKAKRLHLMVSTTPEGKDTWVYRDFEGAPKPNHRVYKGSTARNSALPAEYIETQMASLPPELVAQYLHGEAVDYVADRAHPQFRRETHLTDTDWTRQPVMIGADFNVSPLCWVALQRTPDGGIVALDEIVLSDYAQVDTAMQAAHDKGWHRHGAVHIHPDRSGNNRNRVGDPEVATIMQAGRRLGWDIRCDAQYGANPPVNSRINLVSRMLMDATGRIRLRVHPRCVRLIDELASTGRKANGYDPGSNGQRGHILDALGYPVWDLFAPGGEVTAGSIRL